MTPAEVTAAKGQVTVLEPTRAQQALARRVAASRATIPELTVSVEIDMHRSAALRASLTLEALAVKACGLALREQPAVNGAWRDGRRELYSRVNVGLALAGQDQPVVATVFDADARPLAEIAAQLRDLAARGRAGLLTPPELAGATFTVTRVDGVRGFVAPINPPQAAILALGAVTSRPLVRDGELVVGEAVDATLACDHRILYPADAARFLVRVRELLERP